jgi:hypothetical protein
MNLLQQVAPPVRVAFVRSCEPFECRTEFCGGFSIPLFVTGRPARIPHSCQVVAREEDF